MNSITSINKLSILFLLTVCFLCFVFNCKPVQKSRTNCTGFQDTILHKFVYNNVDSAPEVRGGFRKLTHQLYKNFKYPSGEADYFGKVRIAFVIEANGRIDGKRTIYDPSGKACIFSKQLFVIIDMVKWKPGICNNELVPTLYVLPLNINLQE